MKTYSNEKPKIIENVPNGANYYRYDFKEVVKEKTLMQPSQIQFECETVIIWSPLSKDKITAAVMADRWGLDYENKLLNDYYGAIEGILPIEKKQPYLDFLVKRKEIKEQITKDCLENNILN